MLENLTMNDLRVDKIGLETAGSFSWARKKHVNGLNQEWFRSHLATSEGP